MSANGNLVKSNQLVGVFNLELAECMLTISKHQY
jgi:hypothetical protein